MGLFIKLLIFYNSYRNYLILIHLLIGVSKLAFCSLIFSLKNINIPASITIIHPIIVLIVGMSSNRKKPMIIDQTISEYSNIDVTDVEYVLYALNTQVNAIVAKTPIIAINFQV